MVTHLSDRGTTGTHQRAACGRLIPRGPELVRHMSVDVTSGAGSAKGGVVFYTLAEAGVPRIVKVDQVHRVQGVVLTICADCRRRRGL